MYDYIIVGQGIAGSVLSFTLLQHHKNILVIDKGNMSSCSSAAAGLFNPITGKKMVKTWNAAKLFPFFHQFYREMEKATNRTLMYSLPVYRPFGTLEEQNYWHSNSNPEDPFLNTDTQADEDLALYIHNPYGGIETRYSGWLDVRSMLAGVQDLLRSHGALIEDLFDFQDLAVVDQMVQWRDYQAKGIIFCEGYKAMHNPYFNWIPYSPSKGEILNVRIKNFPEDVIINKNLFMVPIGNEIYRVGATFERTTEEGVSEKGRNEISERLQSIVRPPFEVIGQQSGIRPSVPDRRPLIGVHPEYGNLFIFNGLGTKGVSLSPFYAAQFTQYLEQERELDSEVNIQRYYSLYFRHKG